MSKIVLTADIHLDYRDRLNDTVAALDVVSDYMTENKIDYAIILGDLFNDRSAVSTDATNAAYKFFKKVHEKGQSWSALLGNHDIFYKYSWKIHSLKPLEDYLTVYDKQCLIKIYDQRFWVLPYIHDEEVYMKVLNLILEKSTKDDVLLTHVGVNGATLNECFLHKNWSFISFEDVDMRVYSGHFHCHQQVGKNLWYPGSLIPFRFDEGLVDHGFLVYDTETGEHEFVKIFDHFSEDQKPPDFVTILDDTLEELEESEVRGNNVKISLKREYTNDERVQIREKLEKMGAISISWTKVTEGEVILNEDLDGDAELSLNNPNKLLGVWLKHDNPEWIDRDLIMKLNVEVTENHAS